MTVSESSASRPLIATAPPLASARRPRRASGWLGKAALLLFGLMLPLLVLEVALRLGGPILPGFYRTGTDLVAHPIYGFFHQPNYVGWWKTPEFSAQESINSKGLRERELAYDKPPGTRRILMLGDSYVEAVQVDAGQTVSSRLEALLSSAGRPTEVINAGVGGWGTAQEWLFFRDEGYRYQPDLVVLVVYLGNDIRDNGVKLATRARLQTAPYFGLTADGSLKPLDLSGQRKPEPVTAPERAKQLLRFSLLYNVFETGVLEKLDADPEDGYWFSKTERVFQSSYTKEWTDAWQVTEALLAALKRDVEAHGARLVLVAAPRDLQTRPADWDRALQDNELSASDFEIDKPNRLLSQVASRLELPLIDLLGDFRQAEPTSGNGLYFLQNRHWTPEGHAVAARVIRDGLARLGLEPVAH